MTDIRIEHITPHGASKLLEKNRNRRISQRWVDEFARLMMVGEWRDSMGDPIAIDTDGNLVNGQHRLLAIIKSGHSADFVVQKGVDPTDFFTLGNARPRTKADVLAAAGKANARLLAATIEVGFQIEYGARDVGLLTHHEFAQAAGVVNIGETFHHTRPILWVPSVASYLSWVTDGAADDFIKDVAVVGATSSPDPAAALQGWTLARRSYGTRGGRRVHGSLAGNQDRIIFAGAAIRAWNARCDGISLKKLVSPATISAALPIRRAPRFGIILQAVGRIHRQQDR